ncbi:hypothetical protein FIV41_25410 [Pseudomonas marginalis]|uniref:Uncharacterized protein n=1 Tax=Pseudomonas marginalis TaxID=298 RepID=A0A9X9FVI0_PSEMA|nr:hypothetical protein PspCFBP13509_28210 [Pseudomonas sp. CFBP13509]TWR52791.1 hypothetical protein FIV41_25410 [Pseudomonas marginalis]
MKAASTASKCSPRSRTCASRWAAITFHAGACNPDTTTRPVGASLLAKNPQAPPANRSAALSLMFFASKLAPTKE